MAIWNTGRVVKHKHWSDILHTLYIDADIETFEAGQFVKIGLNINGEIISHPYSLVNSPKQKPLSFYYIDVPNGKLTPSLSKLKINDNVLISPKAYGLMILDEVPIAKELWLMATGTGIGPFLSMLTTSQPWQRYEKIVLVWGARRLSELTYQNLISQLLTEHPYQFIYAPFVSRETSDVALIGRIPNAISDGRLEKRAGIHITAKNSQVMLCGNPQMVKDSTNTLIKRGLRKHKRFSPGHITSENYW
ncbi:MAG: ferredoxin--NADP+ reductase [Methylophilaceae bacterium]|jgi:ferredoxin--NADP+ reductase